MIDEFMQGVVAALPGTVVSLLFSGLLLYYLRKYIDVKLAAEEKRRQEDHKIRRQRSELEQRRRRAAGRVLFWLHHAVTKPPPNGELEAAWETYQAAEEAQKALDQQILADYETGGGH